jgi:hypothetical protein
MNQESTKAGTGKKVGLKARDSFFSYVPFFLIHLSGFLVSNFSFGFSSKAPCGFNVTVAT